MVDKDNTKTKDDQNIEEVISMATISFTKEFSITKKETVEKLEKSIKNIKPLHINNTDVLAEMRKSDDKLLNMLRSRV